VNAIALQFPMGDRLRCAALGHRASVDANTLALTVALADVESYARAGWMRSLQYMYVLGYRQVSGRLPDMSIGPAQIKISNIKRLVKPQRAISKIKDLILDDCANISIAYCFVAELRGPQPLTRENITTIAQLYNGQRKNTLAESSLQYVDLVRRIFSRIRARLDESQSVTAAATEREHICL
jgi:hypothetical protein